MKNYNADDTVGQLKLSISLHLLPNLPPIPHQEYRLILMDIIVLRFKFLICFGKFMTSNRNLSIQERIEQHIISKDGCWITDLSSPRGYPRIGYNHKTRKVSRIMFELHKGEIPQGMFICHKCDNRGCVNPEHLFLGSHEDNMADMVRKNRQAKGSNQGSAKLTEEQVAEIKRLLAEGKLTQRQIGEMFGICQTHVSSIKLGTKWNHIVSESSEAKQLNLFD